jgi:hypothetical protein
MLDLATLAKEPPMRTFMHCKQIALLQPEYPHVRWILLAPPLAKDYYARVGREALDNAWVLPRPGEPMPSYEAFQAQFTVLAARA